VNWTFWIIIVAAVAGWLLLKRASFIGADKARQLLREGAVVVDVRSPGEFNSGHIAGAINIPLGDLDEDAPKRLPDKGKPVLLHCLSGTRSGIARHKLQGLGYTNVFNLGSYGRANRIVAEVGAR
jgi:phage shock protein E